MCGIAGILRITPGSALGDPESRRRALSRPYDEVIPEAWLDLLDADIRHRGPDGQGRFRDRALRADGSVVDVAFVHRRLSIIDHGGGGQPMVSIRGGSGGWVAGAAEGRMAPLVFHGKPRDAVAYEVVPTRDGDDLVATVFNGCVYNHRDLREALAWRGARFTSDHSDTEVLLHGWRAWRGRLLENVDAMFALAIWDRAAAALVLARDPFGEKPLYVLDRSSHAEGVLAFSSMPGALVRLDAQLDPGREGPVVDAEALRNWVRFGFGVETPWRAVRAVRPGRAESWPLGALERRTRPGAWTRAAPWRPEIPAEGVLTSEEVEKRLARAVESRLEADVPLGCFLSGGIDSALVTSLAAESRPDLVAFTVRMPSAEFDESGAAAETARALGVRHEILDCRASPAEDLVTLIGQLGLPFGDSSLLPTHWVSRAARARVAVALSGDGGDDLFLGYDRHRVLGAATWAGRAGGAGGLPRAWWRAIAEAPVADSKTRSLRTRLWRFASAMAGRGYRDLLAIFPYPLDVELGLVDASEYERPVRAAEAVRRGDVHASLQADRGVYLPEDLMRKSDTASMAVALEVRAPFLARGVAERALRASVETLMPGGERKGLLRQIARRRLPGAIVDAPKRGFAIPIGAWFLSDFGGMRTLLLDRMSSREPFGAVGSELGLNMNCVRRMIDEHMKGERDHSQRLYMLVVLSVWGERVGR